MASRDQSPSKTPPTTTVGRTTKPRRRARPARVASTASDSGGGRGAARYAGPAAAVLATGLLAAAGYVFKDRLGDIAAEVLKRATHEASKVAGATSDLASDARAQAGASLDRLLELAGLERRKPFLSILGPAVGVACGFVAGALLTYFFAPRLLEHLGIHGAPENDVDGLHDAHADPKPSVVADVDGAHANGNPQRPIL